MQNQREKEIVTKAYEIEKNMFQQTMLLKMLKDKIDSFKWDKQILDTVNKNGGYSKGKKLDEVMEMAMGTMESETPYQRVRDLKHKRTITSIIDIEEVMPILLVISAIIFIVATIIDFENYSGYVRWIWLSRFWESLFDSMKFGITIVGICYLVLFCICIVIVIPKLAMENEKIKNYNDETLKRNQEILNTNRKKYNERMLILRRLKHEYEYLNNQISDTKRVREQIYNIGIIDPDYQNFIAVSSIYQYFRTGRVETLEGVYGAYNKYEEERRMNLIVQKLDQIIKKLDQIKNNQTALYSAIVESQRTSEKIIGELRKIQTQNNQVIENAYVNSYNSEIVAKNTEFLKWCEVYRMR